MSSLSSRRQRIALGVFAGLVAAVVVVDLAWRATSQSEYERPAPARRVDGMQEGLELLDRYFRADAELTKPSLRGAAVWAARQAEARDAFLAWLDRTEETLGTDLRKDADAVLDLIDTARARYLRTDVRPGELDYIVVADPRGMERHEYAVLLPGDYDPAGPRRPLIVSLHGRVIDPTHPALAAHFDQRSRQVVWNNWLRSPVADAAIVVAPTTRPNGFTFDGDRAFFDLQLLYRTLADALVHYRVDWNRVFLEVEGEAIRAACEQTFMFAGFIVRDRIDNRRRPLIDPDEFFLFANLNGVPLCYIADAAHWNRVGEPIAGALDAAYRQAGARENLVVLKASRDRDDALAADGRKLLAFVTGHERVRARPEFTWRFYRPLMRCPEPFELKTDIDLSADPRSSTVPLEERAGSLRVAVGRNEMADANGRKRLVNLVSVDVTEATGFVLRLADGWIDFDLPLTIRVNGETVLDQQVLERDWRSFWDLVVPKRFFMAPYLGSVEARFDPLPQRGAETK